MIARLSGLYETMIAHPVTDFLVGVALMFTSAMELENLIVSDISMLEGEHGMLLYGVVQASRSLPKIKKQFLDTWGHSRTLHQKITRRESPAESDPAPSA